MEKILSKFNSLEEMKKAEIRYWPSRPAHERIAAVYPRFRDPFAVFNAKNDIDRVAGGYTVALHVQARIFKPWPKLALHFPISRPTTSRTRKFSFDSKLATGHLRDLADVEDLRAAGNPQPPRL